MPTISEARAALRQHRPEIAMRMVEQIRAEAIATGARLLAVEADALASTVLVRMQRFADARRNGERAMAGAVELGSARGLAVAHCALSELHYRGRVGRRRSLSSRRSEASVGALWAT
jgi:hypothetical protein